jgi:hypothetical protein
MSKVEEEIMGYLEKVGPTSAALVAKGIHREVSNVYMLLARLVKKGTLRKEGGGPRKGKTGSFACLYALNRAIPIGQVQGNGVALKIAANALYAKSGPQIVPTGPLEYFKERMLREADRCAEFEKKLRQAARALEGESS